MYNEHNRNSDSDAGESGSQVSRAKSGSRAARPRKSVSAFRTISEVADELGVQQHVLRFWETKFSQVRPLKRGGGRRYYRPEDVELLKRIHHLLYTEGYTIKGVQKLLKGQSKSQILNQGTFTHGASNEGHPTVIKQGLSPRQKEILEDTLHELRELRDIISSG